MEHLLIPAGTYGQLQNERFAYVLDELQTAIDQSAEKCVGVENAEDGRLMTAGAFMLRANDLFRTARAVEAQREACSLTLRSVFELSITGRYFVVGPGAADEFAKAIRDAHKLETQLAKSVGLANADLPLPLQDLVTNASGKSKSLYTMAKELDVIDGIAPGDRGSLVYIYRLCYQAVSNTLTHANALSIKQYMGSENGMLRLHQAVGRSVQPNPFAIASLLCEFAADVLASLKVSSDDLPEPLLKRRSTDWSTLQS
jgi:predicted protein tyrosine phosphatase